MSIRYLADIGEITLALDFDPDSHLYKLLGVQVRGTLGQMVDRIHKEKKAEMEPKKPIDVSDQEYLLSLIAQDVIVEQQGFDLITLGKPSLDIDCYCPVYLWSEYAVSQIMKSYEITYRNIVVDCDPGTEIFPRKILDQIADNPGIDNLLTVIDGSRMSLDTAKDIQDEVRKRKLRVKNILAVCNKVDDPNLQKEIKETAKNNYGIEVIGFVPTDNMIAKANFINQRLVGIHESPAYKAIGNLMNVLRSR